MEEVRVGPGGSEADVGEVKLLARFNLTAHPLLLPGSRGSGHG